MNTSGGRRSGGRLPELTKRTILMLKQAHPEWGCQRISDMLVRGPALPASASAVARVLREAGYEMEEVPTRAHKAPVRTFERAKPNQLWQTDFTYLKVNVWGWYYLSTILDDYSRYIIAWKLCSTMRAEDVTDTLDMALAASGLDQANVRGRPRLLSDNGSSYVAGDLPKWMKEHDMKHVRGAPYHLMA